MLTDIFALRLRVWRSEAPYLFFLLLFPTEISRHRSLRTGVCLCSQLSPCETPVLSVWCWRTRTTGVIPQYSKAVGVWTTSLSCGFDRCVFTWQSNSPNVSLGKVSHPSIFFPCKMSICQHPTRVDLLSTSELCVIVEAAEKCPRIPEKSLGVLPLWPHVQPPFSPPRKQLRDLSHSSRIYVVMAK